MIDNRCNRITDQWNQLPLDIGVSDNVNIFESRVKKFFNPFTPKGSPFDE